MVDGPTSTSRGACPPRFVFVQMPWASVSRPSIALGILSSLCQEQEVEHWAYYPNIELAAAIGVARAEVFSDTRPLFGLSEHLFAVDLFGPGALASDELIDTFTAATKLPSRLGDASVLRDLRDRVIPRFLSMAADRVLEREPSHVGFTAMFNQVMPALALAKRIKQARPDIQVLCGGACFDGEMGHEYHRALPEVIDHVFISEAEDSFREFVGRLRAGRSTRGVAGTTWFEPGEGVRRQDRAPVADMEQSPMPSYDAYFEQRAAIEQERRIELPFDRLPFESSRGCWWGAKNHCVFCGLNPKVLPFRSKSVDRTVHEIRTLSRKHRVTRLIATDWIVSRAQRAELFAELGRDGTDIEIFYETRADLSKLEIELMAAAGVRRVQPGIEALSTPLLRHMRKHSRAIRMIQFLRWCREYSVVPLYHLLAGFPGEAPEWFEETRQRIPSLLHLDPPRHNIFTVELHRFSPLFEHHEEYGITSYEARTDYRFNSPPGLMDLRKTSYFFEAGGAGIPDADGYLAGARRAVASWMAAHQRAQAPTFTFEVGDGFVNVIDGRDGWREVVLEGLARRLLLLCDEVRTVRNLRDDLGPAIGEVEIQRTLGTLVDAGLVMVEGSLYLTLPLSRVPRSTETLRALAGVRRTEPEHEPPQRAAEGTTTRLRVMP